MSPVESLLSVAHGQIGVTENPPDSNQQKYGAEYGVNGVPWCAIFVWWVFQHAGLGQYIPKTAYVPDLLAWGRRTGSVRLIPLPGAIACYDWQNDGVADHVGIVAEVTGRWSFRAIEGNTSPDDRGSQSNGGGVFLRNRVTQQVAGFIYPAFLEDAVALTPADADLVATAVLQKMAGWFPPTGENPPPNWQTVQTRIYSNGIRTLEAVTKLAARPVDVAALAQAIAAHLPAGGGADPKTIAAAVADELSSRLVR